MLAIKEFVTPETALQNSEYYFRNCFEPGLIGVAMTSPGNKFLEVNDKFCEIFGYDRSELLQMTCGLLVHPDDLVEEVANFKRITAGEVDAYSMEGRFVGKDGKIIHAFRFVKCLRNPDGSLCSCMVQMQDITKRKRSEAEIVSYQEQLRSMKSTVLFIEEQERRNIATALHEQIGQPLAMACIKLGGLRQVVGSEDLVRQVDQVRNMINLAISCSRTLTFELSPPILYEQGLEAAIGSLAELFRKEHGLRIDCSDDRQSKPLSSEISILLFQGVRELLVNAMKHAHAQRLTISSRREGSGIMVMVEDDGVGFANLNRSEGELTGSPRSFGLFGLRERLKYFGGNLVVKSKSGRGTQVTMFAPLLIQLEEQKSAT